MCAKLWNLKFRNFTVVAPRNIRHEKSFNVTVRKFGFDKELNLVVKIDGTVNGKKFSGPMQTVTLPKGVFEASTVLDVSQFHKIY